MEVLRNDPIKLHSGVKEEEFERFMIEEMFPFFRQAYGGPATRFSVAGLSKQSLLKEQQGKGTYVGTTTWNGRVEDVQDPLFAGVDMRGHEDRLAMLQKLESFGERTSPCIYKEVT